MELHFLPSARSIRGRPRTTSTASAPRGAWWRSSASSSRPASIRSGRSASPSRPAPARCPMGCGPPSIARACAAMAPRPRVDYKQVLSEADFALFAELRSWRKGPRRAEGVPVYAVFTNEQLAEIVRRRVDAGQRSARSTASARRACERYGAAVLERAARGGGRVRGGPGTMRRDAIALADLAARENLLLATWKAARGKRHRDLRCARFLGRSGCAARRARR